MTSDVAPFDASDAGFAPSPLFLLPEVWTAFANRRIKGLSSPWRADPVMFMEELWVDER